MISTSKKTIPLYFVLVVAAIYRAAHFLQEAHSQPIGPLTEKYVLGRHGIGGSMLTPLLNFQDRKVSLTS